MAALFANTEFFAYQTAEERVEKPDILVFPFVAVRHAPGKAGTAKWQGIYILPRTLHGSMLSSSNSVDKVVIWIMYIDNVWSLHLYPYHVPGVEDASHLLEDMSTFALCIWESRMMMESALFEGASNPESHFVPDAVDDLVSATTDGDEVRSISKVMVNPSHNLNVDVSKGIAVSTQNFKYKDFQMMEVYAPIGPDQWGSPSPSVHQC